MTEQELEGMHKLLSVCKQKGITFMECAELLEKEGKKEEKKEWPVPGDNVYSPCWLNEYTKKDKYTGEYNQPLYKYMGLYHPTEAQAQKHYDFLCAVHKWNTRAKELNENNKVDWNDSGSTKYRPYLSGGITLEIGESSMNTTWPYTHLLSEKHCKQLIKELKPELEIIFSYYND